MFPGPRPRKRVSPAAIIVPVLVGALLLLFAPIGVFMVSAQKDDIAEHGEQGSSSPPSTSTPEAGPRPVLSTATNPVLTTSAPLMHVDCFLPQWKSTPEAAERYFRAALPCLDRAWKPVMQKAGLPFRPPSLAFPSGKYWNSPCGSIGPGDNAAAFYCSGNNTLYMPFEGLNTDHIGDNQAAYLISFAHEYGHHVQNSSGIMEAWLSEAYQAGGTDTDTGLELSRRSELQANCFGGMFLAAIKGPGALSESDAAAGIDDRYTRGDSNGQPRDHGSGDHYGDWAAKGYERNNTAVCDTWSAPSSQVS